MTEDDPGDDARDDQMVRQMEQRRQIRPERRGSPEGSVKPVEIDRRRTCEYCFQPGNHPTAADCLRALER